jgi:hypothetical protein
LLTGCILFFLLTYPAFSVIASGVSLATIEVDPDRGTAGADS